MINKRINSYDETKKMLQTLRKIKDRFSTSLFENDDMVDLENVKSENKKTDTFIVNDVEVKINTSDDSRLELNEEDKKTISQIIDNFKTQVSMVSEFDPGFTIEDNQIRLDGKFIDEDINFVLIAGYEDGLYINSEMLKINDDVVSAIEKLKNFEEEYKTTMEALLSKRNTNI